MWTVHCAGGDAGVEELALWAASEQGLAKVADHIRGAISRVFSQEKTASKCL